MLIMMNKQFFAIVLAGAMCVFAAGGAFAQAQQAPQQAPAAAKIGILNIQRAILESSEGKKAAEKLQTQFTPKQSELQTKQAEIERLQKQLRDQEKTLSDDARANLVRQVEQKTKEFTRTREDAANDLQQAEAQAFNEIGQRVLRVVEDYARKNGYHVLLDVSSPQTPVLWASSAVDVTDEIIKLFNAAPPAASGSAPAAGGAAAPATGGTTAPATRPAPQPGQPAAKKPAPATPGTPR